MPQSLKATDFDYTDEGVWSRYFNSHVRDFVEKAKALNEFRQELVRKCDGMPYDELQDEWDYSQVLLGGVEKDGEYRERSLAKVYSELLGLQFENLKEVVEKQRQGISPSTKVVVEDVPFSNFVSDALNKAETALKRADEKEVIFDSEVEAEYDFYDLLSDQDKFTRLLTDFLQRLQELLPNHNARALFVWTLEKTPNRYLSVAYPKLKDTEVWDGFDRVFGLEPVFVPEIEETGEEVEQKKQQYTIYAYRDGSIGRTLSDLYLLTWGAFDNEVREALKLVFPDLPNFKQEFLDEAHEKLDQIGWELPDEIRLVGENERYSGTRGDTTQAEYHISGVTIDSYTYSGFSTSDNYYPPETKDCDLSLLRVLDDLAPGLFVLNGLEYELRIDEESLEVEKV